jgi:Delta7-sterol 5-desaturase
MSGFADLWPRLVAVMEASLVIDAVRYAVPAFGLALILKLFWNWGLRDRKIQARLATNADRWREIWTSARTVMIFAINSVLTYLGIEAGIVVILGPAGLHDIPYIVASTIGLVLFHDTYFYWTHRAMHHPKLFRRFHRMHHRSITPTPFAAYAFDWPEAVVQGMIVPLWLLMVPMYPIGLFTFLGFMIIRNVMGHAGVELMPRRLADSQWFGWINATTHHDLHHSSFRYNYGLYFTWWDKLMGTEHPEYRARLRGRPEPSVPGGAYIPAGTSD